MLAFSPNFAQSSVLSLTQTQEAEGIGLSGCPRRFVMLSASSGTPAPHDALTVKHPVHVPLCPSGFVTVTFRAPSGAVELTESLTSKPNWVMFVAECTVIPAPENATVAPGWM